MSPPSPGARPGVHCAVPLLTGAAVSGTWFDRSRSLNNAFLRGKALEKGAPLGADGVRAQNPETRPRKINEVAGPVLPRSAEDGSEGPVGGLWDVRCGVPRGGREAEGRRPDGGVPAGSFPPRLPFVEA